MYLGNCKSRRFVSGRASLIKIFIYVLYIGTYYIRVNTVIHIAKRNWNAVKIVLSSLSRHPFCLLPMRNQAAKGLQPHLLSQRGTHFSLETLAKLSSLGRHPFCLVPMQNQAAKGSTVPSSASEGNTCFSGTASQHVVIG